MIHVENRFRRTNTTNKIAHLAYKEDSYNQSKHSTKLMMQGKVHAALRLLDQEASVGIAELNNETMEALKKLHPTATEASEDILLTGDIPFFDPVVFTNINEKAIATAALKTGGGAGPSGLDADGWRRMLVSRNYGTWAEIFVPPYLK